jgi:thiol:disulfide interchange protein
MAFVFSGGAVDSLSVLFAFSLFGVFEMHLSV